MKILKMPETAWSCKHTCINCTAELEIDKSDLKYEKHDSCDPREPNSWEEWKTNCPICGNHISIVGSTLPKAVKADIKKKLNVGGPGGLSER